CLRFFFFFFQAEDGIRDFHVTGVQTCALPICRESGPFGSHISLRKLMSHTAGIVREPKSGHYLDAHRPPLADTVAELATSTLKRSEERRVGKECRSRRSPHD